MKKLLFLISFIPAFALAQDLKFDGWEEWEEEMDFRFYDFGECLCPWLIKGDSAISWDYKNLSPYQWDNSKPIIIKLDSIEFKKYKELFINKPKFTLPQQQLKDKKKPT